MANWTKLHKCSSRVAMKWEKLTCTYFMCAINKGLNAVASIYACFLLYIHVGHWLCVHKRVSFTATSFVLTKHLFCTHPHAGGVWWSSPNPQPRKVSAFFEVGPIDHHYYCSLLIPMEMRPAVVVLGDWGWGQGLPPLASLQNLKSS